MNKKTFLYIAVFLMITVLFSSFQNQQDHRVLFEKAKYTMETKGDLNEAIRLFEQLIKDFPNEREHAAKAQVHIGLCFEKLGKKQATEAYNKVLEQFIDQPDMVKFAKNRLQYLNYQKSDEHFAEGIVETQTNVRKIYSNSGFYGSISPDGKYLSYVDWKQGNMAVHNIKTGKNRIITDMGTWTPPSKFGDMSVWSPDGKFLAYYWINGKNHQLHIQNLETGEDRILIDTIGKQCPWPSEWSSDGKYIIAGTSDGNQNYAIQLVSVKDGSTRIVKMLGDQCTCGGTSMSPDGKYIVASTGKEMNKRDIMIFSVDGTFEGELISFPGADWAPKWTPDGKKVVFASKRTGTPSLWSVEVENGIKVGEAELIYEGISEMYLGLGFIDGSKLAFESLSIYSNIYYAEIIQEEGIIKAPTPITGNPPGVYEAPFWSADGSKLAYIKRHLDQPNGANIIIHNLKSGKEQELKPELQNLDSPRGWASPQWSSDNKNLLLSHVTKNDEKELVILNVETQEKKFVKGESWKVYGPDNTIIYVDGTGSRIIQLNRSTGLEKTLYKSDKQIYQTTISKDKSTLAFFTGKMGEGSTLKELYSMSLKSAEPKMLWRTAENQHFTWYGKLNFFPDGKKLLVSISTRDLKEGKEISQQFYTIDINTLEKRTMGELQTDLSVFYDHVRLSPDGKKIAFNIGKQTTNIWTLEYDF